MKLMASVEPAATAATWRSVAAVRSGSEGVLTSVAVGDAGQVWAAGYRLVAGRYRPMVQRWDSRVWQDISVYPISRVDWDALLRSAPAS